MLKKKKKKKCLYSLTLCIWEADGVMRKGNKVITDRLLIEEEEEEKKKKKEE